MFVSPLTKKNGTISQGMASIILLTLAGGDWWHPEPSQRVRGEVKGPLAEGEVELLLLS